MNKKNIIFGAIAFIAGVATGVTGTIVVQKIKGKHDSSNRTAPLLSKDLKKEEPEKAEENVENGPKIVDHYDLEEDKETVANIISEEQYAAESEYPCEDDHEQTMYEQQLRLKENAEKYRKEHEGRIELMREDEWDTDFPETDYSHEELWWFPDENILTDEDGNELEPIADYVGIIFDKARWEWEEMYIRNHPKEMEYKVHRETRMNKDEFFYC